MYLNNFYVEIEVKQDKKFQVISMDARPFKNGELLDKYLEKIRLTELENILPPNIFLS